MVKTIERESMVIHGWITTLDTSDSAEGLIGISQQKMRAKEEYASKIEEDLFVVNALIDGDQCYLIGNKDLNKTRPSEILLPAGTYAYFDLDYQDQVELDQEISNCYGELMQDETVKLLGNYNLEEYTAVGKLTLYLPVQKK
ncbi:MAG: hypothetical protein RSC16_09710 [Enterococcus sp.]|uniref:effector binding domain-containing protein n=1 Tax=Enterococcus TaxID=1350 RepID=UPI002FCBB6A6